MIVHTDLRYTRCGSTNTTFSTTTCLSAAKSRAESVSHQFSAARRRQSPVFASSEQRDCLTKGCEPRERALNVVCASRSRARKLRPRRVYLSQGRPLELRREARLAAVGLRRARLGAEPPLGSCVRLLLGQGDSIRPLREWIQRARPR